MTLFANVIIKENFIIISLFDWFNNQKALKNIKRQLVSSYRFINIKLAIQPSRPKKVIREEWITIADLARRCCEVAQVKATSVDNAFVIGSAVPHPYPLHLGNYSVHTSAQALIKGEARIKALGKQLKEAGDRRIATGNIPVYR